MFSQILNDDPRADANSAPHPHSMEKVEFDPITVGSNMAALLLIRRYLSPRDLRPEARGWSQVFRWKDETVCEVRRCRAPTDLPDDAMACTFVFANERLGWVAEFVAVFHKNGCLYRPEKLLRLRTVEPVEASREFNSWVRKVAQPLNDADDVA